MQKKSQGQQQSQTTASDKPQEKVSWIVKFSLAVEVQLRIQ